MEKTITMPLSEYEKLCEKGHQNKYELILHDVVGRLVLSYYETDDKHELGRIMQKQVEGFNYNAEYIEKVYNRNLWERIINKRVER